MEKRDENVGIQLFLNMYSSGVGSRGPGWGNGPHLFSPLTRMAFPYSNVKQLTWSFLMQQTTKPVLCTVLLIETKICIF